MARSSAINVRATMKILAIITFITLFPAMCFAVDFTVEDPHLLSVPTDAANFIQSDPSFAELKDDGCGRLAGVKVDLSGDGQREDWVATTAEGCGWGAAVAPIWVLRRDPKGYAIVLAAGGYDLTLGKAKQNGLRHLAIAAGTAGWYSEGLFKYDGTKYEKTRERHVDLSNPEDCRKNRDVCPE